MKRLFLSAAGLGLRVASSTLLFSLAGGGAFTATTRSTTCAR